MHSPGNTRAILSSIPQTPIIVALTVKLRFIFDLATPCRARSSSPPPCPTPTAPSTSVIWSNTSRPTSGCASRKWRGNECWYVCADDTHGTPIMLRAEKEGITPEQLIARVHGEHSRDFAGFQVGFDNYYTTHSDETRDCANDIYLKLQRRRPDRNRAPSSSITTRSSRCSCPTASSRASARSATPRTSTATTAKSAAPPMRRPT